MGQGKENLVSQLVKVNFQVEKIILSTNIFELEFFNITQ